VTIRELIGRSGRKQREVAEQAGLSAQYLCDIVRGRILPPRWTVEAIARVLGVRVEEVNQAITAQYLISMLCKGADNDVPRVPGGRKE